MQDIRIDGMGNISGGQYGKVTIDGMGTCEGELKADYLRVDGKFKCKGELSASEIHCDGMAEVFGDLSGKQIDVNGYLSVKSGTKIEAEKIDCDGYIKVQGQISADLVQADGFISAQEIVGDKVVIRSSRNFLSQLFSKASSKVELIEATTIELKGVVAQTVNGSNIVIGPNCLIENLDCNGSLSIDRSAKVNHITGNYKTV